MILVKLPIQILRRPAALLLGLCSLFGGLIAPLQADDSVKVGVLAHRGEQKARKAWQPTMDYLGATIPGRVFELIPLRLKPLRKATAEGQLDFVLTNPGQYVELEAEYGITRLATRRNLRQGAPYDAFGSVIFARRDNNNLQDIGDIAGRRFAGVKPQAFGAFQTAWYELHKAGIDPFNDTELIFTGIPQDAVVYAVRDGLADAGTVRTDVMERMAKEGLIALDDYRLLQSRTVNGFPFQLSTALYPEWPFARTRDTGEELARDVALALLSMPDKHPAAAAAKYAGWQVPGNYNSIHEMYRAIRYGPYEHYGEFSLGQVVARYWHLIGLIGLLLLLLAYHTWQTSRLNRQLEAAKSRAEAANLAKTTFLANMSHEIRTPLNAVLGYVQVLKSAADLPQQYLPQLGAIASAGNHLLRLINDILDLSRIESGIEEINQQSFSLERLAEGLSGVFDMRCADHGLSLICEIDVESDSVVGDEGRVRQVLYNLLGNAIKFTRHGEVKLIITQHAGDTRFEVADSGRGIPTDQLSGIFAAFKQTDEGQRAGGSGLGLNISQRLVQQMGGRLEVLSELDQGSRFFFTLPLPISTDDDSPAAATTTTQRFALAPDQSLYALIVDDIEDNRQVLVQILALAGIETSTGNNGQEALHAIAQRRPDLVFMDIRMPIMSGIEAISEIRRRWGAGLPCIAVSASASGASPEQAQQAGFDAFMPKPFTVEQLFALVTRFGNVRLERDTIADPGQVGDTDSADHSFDATTSLPPATAIAPACIERLQLAAEQNRITALKRELQTLQQGDPASQALAQALSPLLARYDLEALRAVLQRYAND